MNDAEHERKQQTQVLLNRRNTETVELKIRELDNTIREQQQQINNLNNYISTLDMKFNQLEQRLNIDKIMKMGNGPTVR